MDTIEHKGKVIGLSSGTARIMLENVTACGSCEGKDICALANAGTKDIDIPNPPDNIRLGDDVVVSMQESLGLKALCWGYLFPFCVILLALIFFSVILKNELLAGTISIALLVPYYLGLYIWRDRLGKQFTYTLKKV